MNLQDQEKKTVSPSSANDISTWNESWNPLAWSPRKLVYALCAGSTVFRFLFLALPTILGWDERGPVEATRYPTASEYLLTSNWGERWRIVEYYSEGGRILWLIGHLLWANLFPGASNEAFALSAVASVIAMLALAGAARRLYGERGFLLALLLISLSPFFLNYSVRVLAVIQSVMWLCVALFCFCSRRWSLGAWLGGGVSLGLGFGTYYGAGPTVVAIALGLGVSVLIELFRRGPFFPWRPWNCLVCPVLGGAAALLPLLTLEYWAQDSGTSYLNRLFHHENLTWDYFPGPYGLWLREFFECEPLFQILMILVAGWVFRAVWLKLPLRILLEIAILGAVILAAISMQYAFLRAWISVFLFVAVPIAVLNWKILDREWMNTRADSITGEAPVPPVGRAPFGRVATLVSFCALFVVYTIWRKVSDMPRLTFAGWPVLLLGFCGLLLAVFRDRWEALLRTSAVLGIAILIIGGGTTYYYKNGYVRMIFHSSTHPGTRTVDVFDLIVNDRGYEPLRRRASDDFKVVAASGRLYPATGYDDELYKVLDLRRKLQFNNLGSLLHGHELTYGFILFDEGDPSGRIFPPPGTPMVPHENYGLNFEGKPYFPRIHPFKGMELAFPASDQSGDRTLTAVFALPALAGRPTTFGMEFQAGGGIYETKARLALQVLWRDQAILNLAPSLGPVLGEPQVVTVPFTPKADREEFKVVATLQLPEDEHCPPVSCYLRRPFIQKPYVIPSVQRISGYAELTDADQVVQNVAFNAAIGATLARTRQTDGPDAKGVSWNTEPWNGDTKTPLVFACSSEMDPDCQLFINGKKIMQFVPGGQWKLWDGHGFLMEFRYLDTRQGTNGVMSLKIPKGGAPTGEPLKLAVKMGPQSRQYSWFGIREIQNAPELLPK